MAKSVRIPRTGSPRRALTLLAGAGATGALHIGTDDCLYLVAGEVVFAESGSSPSIGDLLTASDRLAPETWLTALATGGAAGKSDVRPSAWLVQQGHLTHGELELCVLGAIYDAAYFALGSASALLRFVDGETHGMGAVTSIDPALLAREAARRRKLLDEIYAEPGVDHGPVIPVRRPPVPRVVLSALQWEIVGQADGTLTPVALARKLGRAGYAVLTEVRRLAAAGLIALPAGAIPLPVQNAPIKRPVPAIPYTDQVDPPAPAGPPVAMPRRGRPAA
ncbi:ADAM 12 protein, partial [Asanoa iriomotensis]|uniref:ADAM 12 protein n=1 Tax=Asanoa iriomotensis TaxID=234613 RepID=UPI0031D385D9